MDNRIERRFLDQPVIQNAGNENIIESYASVYDSWSEDLCGFREIIKPGAFKNTIINDDIRGLKNHDPNLILGRNKSGTLRLFDDSKGLRYEIDLPETSYAKDLKESIKRGDISQNSFGFITVRDRWGLDKVNNEEIVAREVLEVRLFDVSPVTFPAYTETEGIKLRNMRGLFIENGINFDLLSNVIIRKKHNLDIRKGDREIIQESINFLTNLITIEEKNTNEPSLNGIEILKRRLELYSK